MPRSVFVRVQTSRNYRRSGLPTREDRSKKTTHPVEVRSEGIHHPFQPYRQRFLSEFTGRVSNSGEGRWTCQAAIEEGVPAPVLTTALYSRFASRHLDEFADKALSAMRHEFGGHQEKLVP